MRTWLLPRVVSLLILLLALAISGHVLAQTLSPPQPGFPGGGLWKAPPHRAVPIQVKDGLIVTTGSLGGGGRGSGPMAVVLDTAATATIIDSGLAQRLGWKPTGANYPDRTLELAGASVSNLAIYGLPMTGLTRQTGAALDGIAGSDIFLHFAVRIDYVHAWMMLEVPESCATPEKKLALRVVGGLPFVEASVSAPGGAPMRGLFLIDTGQPGAGLILTSEFLVKHPELTAHQPTAVLPAFDASGAVRDTTFLRVGTLLLGDQRVPGVVAAIAPPAGKGDSGLAGVIGAGVLGRFDLLVDLPRQLLSLTPNADFAAPFETDMSGMLLLSGGPEGPPGEHAYTIAGIAAKSPASEAGLRLGDQLVTVAGRRVSTMSVAQLRGILQSKPGAKVTVGIDRAGSKIQVTLTLRRPI